MAVASEELAARDTSQVGGDIPVREGDSSARLDALIDSIVEQSNAKAECWRDTFLVSMSRASAMTGLKENEIRYFENLGVLQVAKSTEHGAGNRLFSAPDLRRLHALALLRREQYRPAEAAEIVKRYKDCIDAGVHRNLTHLVSHEINAITDGFFLSRLLSQLLDAAHAEFLDHEPGLAGSLRIRGALLPLVAMQAPHAEPDATIQQIGASIARAAKGMLVALARDVLFPAQDAAIPPLTSTGRDDTTVLFYSPRAWELPGWNTCRYCVYVPRERPELTLWLMIDAPATVAIPAVLSLHSVARQALFDRLLALCESVFREFSSSTLTKNYRYRSDGYQLAHTRATYNQLLARIRQLVFPGDDQSMVALLIPDTLEQPMSLAILAHDRYPSERVEAERPERPDEQGDLALRACLSLSGEGQGLCGRAYNLRETFLSREANTDRRIAYGVEEHCHVAMAIPLATSGGLPPFGVLYLASRQPGTALTTEAAYVALVLCSILSELLGRWWLTRQRRMHDARLHQRVADMTRWLDSLSQHSIDFARAIERLTALWNGVADDPRLANRPLTLVALDIDHYRRRVQQPNKDPLPLAAQAHVRQAIARIRRDTDQFWCMNDHALLVLVDVPHADALAFVRRVVRYLATAPSPLVDDHSQQIPITVSAALSSMTLQDLHDLDPSGGEQLRCDLQAILDDLRNRAPQQAPQAIWFRTIAGWKLARPDTLDIAELVVADEVL